MKHGDRDLGIYESFHESIDFITFLTQDHLKGLIKGLIQGSGSSREGENRVQEEPRNQGQLPVYDVSFSALVLLILLKQSK